jgi:DNA-binding LytR/AlgR family response regulator
LSAVLAKVDPRYFRRIHRSHIVNIAHVAKVLPWLGGDALVMMRDGRRWRMSRNYRGALASERC